MSCVAINNDPPHWTTGSTHYRLHSFQPRSRMIYCHVCQLVLSSEADDVVERCSSIQVLSHLKHCTSAICPLARIEIFRSHVMESAGPKKVWLRSIVLEMCKELLGPTLEGRFDKTITDVIYRHNQKNQ
ncbi:hypothetical protein NPIL_72201 [Nephila pilipes]|uniref:Uncharacterized protein n=1 Tax=Nephila pilipes TaxID=299642 RepID=A0A8X6NHS8_NEPPI|nr:hypothetical protein NPIL_72201 [Nephila pilipes]